MSSVEAALTGLTIGGKTLQADISGVVTDASLTLPTGAVSELTLVLNDPSLRTYDSDLGKPGAKVVFGSWSGEATSPDIESADGIVNWHASSALARALRNKYKVSRERKVSARDWIGSRVRQHGGSHEFVSAAGKKSAISQGSDQTELDIINSLCGDLDWTWAQFGNFFFAGTAWDFWRAARPTWPVTWQQEQPSDALDIVGGLTPDDKEKAGEITVQYPYDTGRLIRPLHKLLVAGRKQLNGEWLITGVNVTIDGSSPAEVTAIIPRKPKPKKRK